MSSRAINLESTGARAVLARCEKALGIEAGRPAPFNADDNNLEAKNDNDDDDEHDEEEEEEAEAEEKEEVDEKEKVCSTTSRR